MTSEQPLNKTKESLIEVRFTSTFKRNIRALSKRYPSIQKDIAPVIKQLQNREAPGDRITDVPFTVLKVRVRNSDARRGKSGGYRLIYYLKTSTSIILLTIYSKSDQEDIATKEISNIINQLSDIAEEK